LRAAKVIKNVETASLQIVIITNCDYYFRMFIANKISPRIIGQEKKENQVDSYGVKSVITALIKSESSKGESFN